MARYFVSPQGFEFPDDIFPRCTALEAPKTPLELAAVLEEQQASIGDRPLADRVRWAQSVIHQSELYGSLSRPCVTSALGLVEGAAASNGLASYLVGNWSLFGLFGKPRDKETAKKYYKQAIKLHYSRGWYRMGVSAEEKRDFDVAVSRYESGASLRDAACLYRLAVALLKGQLGFQQDRERALALFELACDHADEDFCQPLYLFGLMFTGEVEGAADSTDVKRGLDLVSRAAALHFAPALVRMANAYQHSERPYDYTAVLRYLHCAARQERHAVYLNRGPSFSGNVEAQLTKVLLCGAPPLHPPNEEWAYKFAAASADLGNSTAQFALGYFEEVGIWVQPNPEAAQEMYRKSAANNCEAAKQRIASLKSPLKRANSLTRRDHEVAVHRQLSRGERKEERADTIVMRMVGEKPPYPDSPSAQGPQGASSVPPRRGLEASPALAPQVRSPHSSSPPKPPYPSVSPVRSPVRSVTSPVSPVSPVSTSVSSSMGSSVVLPSPSASTAPYPSTPRSVSYKVPSAAGYPVTPTNGAQGAPFAPAHGHSRSRSVSPERPQAVRECSPGIAELELEPSVSPERPQASPPQTSPGPPRDSPSRSPSPGRRSPRALMAKFRSKFGSVDVGSSPSLASFVSDAPSLQPATGAEAGRELPFTAPPQPPAVRYFTPPPAAWGTKVNRKPTSSSASSVSPGGFDKSSSASPVSAQTGSQSSQSSKSQGSALTGPVIFSSKAPAATAKAPASAAPAPAPAPAAAASTPSPQRISLPSRTPSPQKPTPYPQDTPTELKRMSATPVRRPHHKHTQSSVVRPTASATASSVSSARRNFSTPLEPPKQFTSFDQMGIQIVAEDKAGPCVIA